MHLDIEEIIEIPENVEVIIGKELLIKGPKGEVKKKINVQLEIVDKKIILKKKNATKNHKRMIMTSKAHIKNMFKGVLEGYLYKLQICFVHFPMTVHVEKDRLLIKNFLGESKERSAKIYPNVELKVEGDIIKITSADKEAAGQTAANIETATRVTNRDRRIFQDGIWLIETPDKKMLE